MDVWSWSDCVEMHMEKWPFSTVVYTWDWKHGQINLQGTEYPIHPIHSSKVGPPIPRLNCHNLHVCLIELKASSLCKLNAHWIKIPKNKTLVVVSIVIACRIIYALLSRTKDSWSTSLPLALLVASPDEEIHEIASDGVPSLEAT